MNYLSKTTPNYQVSKKSVLKRKFINMENNNLVSEIAKIIKSFEEPGNDCNYVGTYSEEPYEDVAIEILKKIKSEEQSVQHMTKREYYAAQALAGGTPPYDAVRYADYLIEALNE